MHHGPEDGKIFSRNGHQVHEYYCTKCTFAVNRDDHFCDNCGETKPWIYHWELDPDMMKEIMKGSYEPQANSNNLNYTHKKITGNR